MLLYTTATIFLTHFLKGLELKEDIINKIQMADKSHHNQCHGGGKGGKGGMGGPGMPSGHDGEVGEPGPFGKGGAGGRPAVRVATDIFQHNIPWYSRWFGIGGSNTNDENIYTNIGGGRGGRGGKGGPGMPNGHDGEDGEPGPYGKGGAGGKTAVSVATNIFQHNAPWYTSWFGIGGSQKNDENGYTSGGCGKGRIEDPSITSDIEDCEGGQRDKCGTGIRPSTTTDFVGKCSYDETSTRESDKSHQDKENVGHVSRGSNGGKSTL